MISAVQWENWNKYSQMDEGIEGYTKCPYTMIHKLTTMETPFKYRFDSGAILGNAVPNSSF